MISEQMQLMQRKRRGMFLSQYDCVYEFKRTSRCIALSCPYVYHSLNLPAVSDLRTGAGFW